MASKAVQMCPEQVYLLVDTILDLLHKDDTVDARIILDSIEIRRSDTKNHDDHVYEEMKKKLMDTMVMLLRYIAEKQLDKQLQRLERSKRNSKK